MNRKSKLTPRIIEVLCLLMIAIGVAVTPIVASSRPRFLSVNGTWIVDGAGRPILLRGINYQDNLGVDTQPGYRYPLHSENDYAIFASLGFNVVRLPVTWSELERTPGSFDLSFLAKYVDQDVLWASKNGLYIVLEMDEGNWSGKFGGAGAPQWTVRQYSATDSGMMAAIANFWINDTLQEHLADTWGEIAHHYANEPTIAGYDILNEPWAYMSDSPKAHAAEVTSFYTKVLISIRAVDKNHILFLEPDVFNTYALPMNAQNIVWAPHFYPLSFAATYSHQDEKTLEADFLAKYTEFVLNMVNPMWIGEFGAFTKDASYRTWLKDARSLFEKYQIGWAWFAFYSDGPGRRPIPTQICLTNPYP